MPPRIPSDPFDDHESPVVAQQRARAEGRAAAERLYWAIVRELHAAQGRTVAPVTASEMATIAGAAHAPLEHVQVTWPLIVQALALESIDRPLVRAGAAATIAAETYGFGASEVERGDVVYFARYDGRLGNSADGDGYRYRGRGPAMLTGKRNYQQYGDRLGINLVAEPERAAEPELGARIFANYFHHARVSLACEREDWLLVRFRVNGGYGNWNKFAAVLQALLPSTVIPTPPTGAIA